MKHKNAKGFCGGDIDMRWATISCMLVVIMAICVFLMFYRLQTDPRKEDAETFFAPRQAPLYLSDLSDLSE
jgi:hypothetical protein